MRPPWRRHHVHVSRDRSEGTTASAFAPRTFAFGFFLKSRPSSAAREPEGPQARPSTELRAAGEEREAGGGEARGEAQEARARFSGQSVAGFYLGLRPRASLGGLGQKSSLESSRHDRSSPRFPRVACVFFSRKLAQCDGSSHRYPHSTAYPKP